MTDISLMIENYLFNFRVSALIENNGRYLLESSPNFDFKNLPGGRVKIGEDTLSAIKRELKEELNLTDIEPKLLKVAEQFFNHAGKKVQELNFVYYIHLDNSHELTQKDKIINLDNNQQEMIWIAKKSLKSHKILPTFIYEIENNEKISHLIHNEL